MGHARWNDADWDRYAAGLKERGRADIFRSRGLAREFDPARIDVRESRDSTHNPAATPHHRRPRRDRLDGPPGRAARARGRWRS